jgi:hypothetical protein
MAAENGTDRFKSGERVVAARPLPGVPEGTRGKVIMVEGFTWIRYWVRFANGVVRGSLHRDKLARAKDWRAIVAERERIAALPKEEETAAADGEAGEAAGAAGAAGDEGAEAGAGAVSALASRVPAHLLERSRQARSKATSG